MTGWIILALVIIAIAVFVGIYNSLVNKRNEYKNAFAQIDVQLTRRYDLIPNLVEVARKYLQHEQETLTSVIAARNHAANALKNTGGGTAAFTPPLKTIPSSRRTTSWPPCAKKSPLPRTALPSRASTTTTASPTTTTPCSNSLPTSSPASLPSVPTACWKSTISTPSAPRYK